MKIDKFNEKIFIFISVILNIVSLYLLILNIIEYRENALHVSNIATLNKDILKYSSDSILTEIRELNYNFNRYLEVISPKEIVATYSQFISDQALQLNIQLENTKVIKTNKEYIDIETNLSGNIESITKLIMQIEKSSPLREVQSTKIKFDNNRIFLNLVVRNYIIK